ncbi:uncharacterized protein LOC123004894 [Tribolium madens]|uniref:uncharacterized protein LOC123004894 n=1 Tax=Tribolium madens TaxID=41895 RepID=UPI001CF71FAC|nr:uncharacterized protein LOC123004894 [Tribolium madens]
MPPSELLKSARGDRPTGYTCRRRLQSNFEECDKNETKPVDRSVLSVLSFNENTRKIFRNSAERFSKTLNTVRTTFGSITQKFRVSTRRRQILEEGPMTPNCDTPYTFSKQVLGRTPTKLYSPFGIETPSAAADKENRGA